MIGSAIFTLLITCALFGSVYAFSCRLDESKVSNCNNFKRKVVILTQLGLLKN